MDIKIIGAGFPRTGTTTLKQALEQLGYTKTYHMKELLVHPENLHYWTSLQAQGTTNWDELYNGYEASVDFPGYPFYKEHMEQYPDAKVILTVRPFETWYDSAYSTVWQAGPQTVSEKIVMLFRMMANSRIRKVVKCIRFFEDLFWEKEFHGKFKNKDYAQQIYSRHIKSVKDHVPSDKLLVYDVRDGWDPLCEFLGLPVPSDPLPHLNKKENFKTMLGELMKGNMV